MYYSYVYLRAWLDGHKQKNNKVIRHEKQEDKTKQNPLNNTWRNKIKYILCFFIIYEI